MEQSIFNARWPCRFAQTTQDLFGNDGQAWLDELPQILDKLATRWHITLQEPFLNLSYNFVAPAIRHSDNTAVVLKIGFPRDELRQEIAALRFTHGRGQLPLLASDDDLCALLLPRLQPGTSLWACGLSDDDRATHIAADVMQNLWRPLPPTHPTAVSFPHVRQWAEGLGRLRQTFGGGTGPFPPDLVALAERLFAQLLDTANPRKDVLLHGDLHHDNILSHGDTWLAIDPKGMRGEPAYEVGAWLRNPWTTLFELEMGDIRARLLRRVAIFSERLGLERERLIGYGIAQAVLSGWWSYEDHGRGWEGVLVVAEALRGGV